MKGHQSIIVRAALMGAAFAAGLAPAASQNATPPQAVVPAPAAPPPAAAAYSYDADGRRDPFVSLVARGSDPQTASSRPPGLPGLLIGEVVVKGIVRDRSAFLAMVQGADTRTFIVRSGERLMDGTIKAVTADSVVFSQDVTDSLSLVKQKEVRKTIRSADGGQGSGAGDR